MKAVRGPLVLALALLQGCAHGVIHDGGGPVKLEPMPRQALRASLILASNNGTNAHVERLIKDSGYFAAVDPSTTTATDVEITFKGNECADGEYLSDTFIGTWFGALMTAAVTLPTLGSIPPWHAGKWDCSRNFAYRLLRYPNAAEREVSHPYSYVQYKTTFSHFLLTSEAREQYQLEYSVDQAVARLLNDISYTIAVQEQSR